MSVLYIHPRIRTAQRSFQMRAALCTQAHAHKHGVYKETSCDETEHGETFFTMLKKSKKALMPDGSQFQFVPSPLQYTSYKTIRFLSARSYFKNFHLLKCCDATSLSKLLIFFYRL